MSTHASRVRWRWLSAAVIVVLAVAGFAGTSPGRRLIDRFVSSLRMRNVQAVNVDLSSFVGPNANPTIQQMISQMVSDKVTTTISEKPQKAATRAEATQLAGFPVALLGKRKTPELMVNGKHAFVVTVDRSRLQAILKEAGRSDLAPPKSIDGARVSVSIPRSVRARYGTCPTKPKATANIATPPPSSTQYSDCILLAEGPSPDVEAPAGLSLQPLAEIGLELAGMTPQQARQFLHNVNWKSALGAPIPRFMRSYESVTVNGVKGTLFNMAGRRGPTYALIWAKDGIIYSIRGFGSSGDAVALADSLS